MKLSKFYDDIIKKFETPGRKLILFARGFGKNTILKELKKRGKKNEKI